MTDHCISDRPVQGFFPRSANLSQCRRSDRSKHKIPLSRAIVNLMFVGLLLTVLSATGCATKVPLSGQTFNQTYAFSEPPKTIAILPFVNRTRNPEIADILRIVFYCHLSAQPYSDVELHIVDQKLSTLNQTDAIQIQKLTPQVLGRLLGADALIMGEITEFQRIYLGVYSQLSLGASISVVDTRNGRTIWKDKYTSRIHEGGVPLTLFEIPFVSIRSGLNLTESVKIRAADNLSRYLAMRIPARHIPNYSSKMAATCPVPITDYFLRPQGDVSENESLIIK